MLLLSILCNLLSLFGGSDISLVFAGDAMQHERQLKAARTADGYDYSNCFRHISTYVSEADYAVINLECTLGGKPYTGYPCFSAPDSFASALRDSGFDLFLHANNHCLDRRDAGLARTLDKLDELGIPHIGTYRTRHSRDSEYPLVADVKGVKIGFLNYTYGTNGIEVRKDVVVDYIDTALIASDIRKLRNKGAELIAVCIHWGLEYKLIQNKEQERLADFLIDQGVDLIIGGHPHVIQPMMIRHSKKHKKDVLVVYSLGNFISGMRTTDTRGGAMVRVVIGTDGSKPYLKEAAYKLVFVQDPKQGGNYELIPADRPDLLRKESVATFEKFNENARRIFNRYNQKVPEDNWKWTPTFDFPSIVGDLERILLNAPASTGK